ncbi:uncharacterized protein [Amphiura filiformis]|uniref:uncharacterized protein n=1 Tax=Amphiura filiformis TaxID=82378 RepID=UPI003B21537A
MAERTVNMREVDQNDDDAIIEEVVYIPEPNSSSDEEEFYMTNSLDTKRHISSPPYALAASDEENLFDGYGQQQDEQFTHHAGASNLNPNLGQSQPNKYSREQIHTSDNTKHHPSKKPNQRPVPAPRKNVRNSQTNVRMDVRTPPKNSRQLPQHNRGPYHDEGVLFNSQNEDRRRIRYEQHPRGNQYNRPHTHNSENSFNPQEGSPDDNMYRPNRPKHPVYHHYSYLDDNTNVSYKPSQEVFDSAMRPTSRRPQSNYGQRSSMYTKENGNATVVVSKISPKTSADLVRMYFENNQRSGGGVITQYSLDQDVANITFLDPAVAREVTQRSHKLEGSTLSVIPGERKKTRSNRPYDPYRLCLMRIPHGVTDEVLTYFIDGRTQKQEDPDISYGEEPGTALLTYPTKIDDIDHVIQNFKTRKLKDSFVKASRVQVTDSILVQNLKPGSSQQSIELYFESTKNSGGDCVREVRLFEDKNQAVVFFENWKVVKRVTGRKHTLEGFSLKVTHFYDFLGAKVSADGPMPRIPNPEVVDVDPFIAANPGEREKPRSNRPYDPYCLCLTGIPDGMTDEVLTYFIDGRTQKQEDPDISYGEEPGTALLTYPTKIDGLLFLFVYISSLPWVHIQRKIYAFFYSLPFIFLHRHVSITMS